MTALGEQPVCACGLAMHPIRQGSDHHICYNCDQIQPSEYTGLEGVEGHRTKTAQDHRFNLEWEKRKREHYPKSGRQAA